MPPCLVLFILKHLKKIGKVQKVGHPPVTIDTDLQFRMLASTFYKTEHLSLGKLRNAVQFVIQWQDNR